MNCLENFYIQQYQLQGLPIVEQNIGEINPLFAVVHDSNSQCASAQILHSSKQRYTALI
jgi:hypothetical protein